jgi:hypothetical protein
MIMTLKHFAEIPTPSLHYSIVPSFHRSMGTGIRHSQLFPTWPGGPGFSRPNKKVATRNNRI